MLTDEWLFRLGLLALIAGPFVVAWLTIIAFKRLEAGTKKPPVGGEGLAAED